MKLVLAIMVAFLGTAVLLEKTRSSTHLVLVPDAGSLMVKAHVNRNWKGDARDKSDPCVGALHFLCFEIVKTDNRSWGYLATREDNTRPPGDKPNIDRHERLVNLCPDDAGFMVLNLENNIVYTFNESESSTQEITPTQSSESGLVFTWQWDVRQNKLNAKGPLGEPISFNLQQAHTREGMVIRGSGLDRVEYIRAFTGTWHNETLGKCDVTIEIVTPSNPYPHSSILEVTQAELDEQYDRMTARQAGNEYGIMLELCAPWDLWCMTKYSWLALMYDTEPVFEV